MPGDGENTLKPIEENDLRSLMATMQEACDVVRIVDPSTFEARSIGDGLDFCEPYKCHTALCHDRRCENCISMRAVNEGRNISKFEFVDGDAYFISARPFMFEGRPHSLEMVQKVSDDIGVQNGLENLQEHVQEETDHKFIDGFTGAYTRKYFDDGLRAMRGRKLAIVKIENLARINEEDGYPAGDVVLKRIAREIQKHTRIVDSVVHYKGNKFLVQFEDMDSDVFPGLIDEISKAVNGVTIESHPRLHPMVFIAAVDEDATFGELADRALQLLAEAEETGERIVIHSVDDRHQARHSARIAAFSETLHHAPDKLIADTDELTGFHTSSSIRMQLQHLLEERHPIEDGYCAIYLDIENFKRFNRSYGMQGGDMLLKYLSEQITAEFPNATAARISADVFLVITNEPEKRERLERIRNNVAGYQKRIALELKAGLVAIDEASKDVSAVIDLAKIACESIKGRFDLGVRVYDSELDQEISMNEYVVNNIDRAIEQGHIKVYFQPIIRAMTGNVCDYEALCRWDDPDHGLLPPGSFIPALEHFHLINKLDAYMVQEICRHQASIIAAGKQVVPVSVNFSRLDFQLDDMVRIVESAVAETGIPKSALTIEVTESALDEDADFFIREIDRLRDAGFEVWMDDFGSGYSSLNLLKDYRFDTLKIDMAFLAGFESNPKSREIIVTIVDMAKKLGIRTLIEGVETKQQYRFLQRIGCEMLQGFYFGKPRPYSESVFSEFTAEHPDERAYFDRLGSVNLLGISSAENAPTDDVTESESRSTPMALIEHRSNSYRFLSANEAFLKLLEHGQASSVEAVQDDVSSDMFHISEDLEHQLDQTRETGEETIGEQLMGANRYQVHIRHVATGPDAHAYVVIPKSIG